MNEVIGGYRVGGALAAILIGCAGLPFSGCRPASDAGDKETVPAKSSAELLVDGITGKYAVDAGQRAKADIDAISKQQNARLEEVLEE